MADSNPLEKIAKGALGVASAAPLLPVAIGEQTANLITDNVKKGALGSVGAITGMVPPNVKESAAPTTNAMKQLLSYGDQNIRSANADIGKWVKSALLGAGFTEPAKLAPPTSSASPVPINSPGGVASSNPLSATMGTTMPMSKPKPIGVQAATNNVISPPVDQTSINANGKAITSINPNTQPLGVPDTQQAHSDILSHAADNEAYLKYQKENSNPNDDKFRSVVNQLVDVATSPAGNLNQMLNRKYAMMGLKEALGTLAPLTSQGQYGVASMHNEEATRHNLATENLTKSGQELTAEHQKILSELDKQKIGIEKTKANETLKKEYIPLMLPLITSEHMDAEGNKIKTTDMSKLPEAWNIVKTLFETGTLPEGAIAKPSSRSSGKNLADLEKYETK